MTKDKSIFIKNIYYMLSYAFTTLKESVYDDIQKESFENIHNLFAAILAKGIGSRDFIGNTSIGWRHFLLSAAKLICRVQSETGWDADRL